MDTRYRVKNFWKYFMGVYQEIEQAFHNQDEELLAELRKEVNLQVQSVCDASAELEWQDGFFELTFNGGMNKTKQYICALLKKSAPKELIDDWIISGYRQPLSQSALHAQLKLDDEIYSGTDFTIYYEINHEAKCIDTAIYSKALQGLEETKQHQIATAMLELFIGEIELEARIGDLQILNQPKEDAENYCLLPNFYEDICDIVIDEEWSEYQEPCAIYAAYKLDQCISGDTLRKDMKLIITTNSLLQNELLNQENDSCEEAKRFGSEYGYLYYEIEQDKEQIALVRQQLEKELQELFYENNIARMIGGAIGTVYAYVDCIVFDTAAFEILLEKLNEHLSFPLYYRSFM